MNKIKATYVSVWDGDIEIRTDCEYEIDTKTVSDIESSDVDGIDCLDDEYVELPDGTVIREFYNEDNCEFVGDVVCPECGSTDIRPFTDVDPDFTGWCCNDCKAEFDYPKL